MRYLLILACFLPGCGWSRSGQSQVAERETTTVERPAFAPDGTGYVEVTKTIRIRDQVTTDQATTTAQLPEIGAAVKLVANAATGGTGSLIALGITSLTTVGAGVAAYLKSRESAFHKADAAEGWAKAETAGAVPITPPKPA